MTSLEDESFSSNKPSSYSRKIFRTRSKSPMAQNEPHSRPHSRAGSVSREASPSPFYGDEDDDEGKDDDVGKAREHVASTCDTSSDPESDEVPLAEQRKPNRRVYRKVAHSIGCMAKSY